MSNLHELFDAATADAPPSRLSVEDVYAATRTRRLRLRSALAAALATLAVTAGGIALGANNAANRPDGDRLPGPLVWVGRGDATQLYAVRDDCPLDPSANPVPGPGCRVLLASSDGGVTWTSRGTGDYPPVILAPQALMRSRGLPATTPAPTDPALTLELSTDGGETWQPMPRNGPPIDTVPAQSTLTEFGGGLTVFDPVRGRLRKLAHQPGLRLHLGSIAITGAHIWLSGYNPATLRPAVAVSHDAGAAWTVRDLPGTAANPQPTLPNGETDPNTFIGQPVQVIAGDGQTAYATIWDGTSTPAQIPGTLEDLGWLRTYRTTDGGLTWQVVAPGSTTPSYACGWLSADGRIVVALSPQRSGGQGYVYAASTDGITYTPVAPPGLPTQLKGVDGSTAFSETDVYVSTDGWTWHKP